MSSIYNTPLRTPSLLQGRNNTSVSKATTHVSSRVVQRTEPLPFSDLLFREGSALNPPETPTVFPDGKRGLSRAYNERRSPRNNSVLKKKEHHSTLPHSSSTTPRFMKTPGNGGGTITPGPTPTPREIFREDTLKRSPSSPALLNASKAHPLGHGAHSVLSRLFSSRKKDNGVKGQVLKQVKPFGTMRKAGESVFFDLSSEDSSFVGGGGKGVPMVRPFDFKSAEKKGLEKGEDAWSAKKQTVTPHRGSTVKRATLKRSPSSPSRLHQKPEKRVHSQGFGIQKKPIKKALSEITSKVLRSSKKAPMTGMATAVSSFFFPDGEDLPVHRIINHRPVDIQELCVQGLKSQMAKIIPLKPQSKETLPGNCHGDYPRFPYVIMIGEKKKKYIPSSRKGNGEEQNDATREGIHRAIKTLVGKGGQRDVVVRIVESFLNQNIPVNFAQTPFSSSPVIVPAPTRNDLLESGDLLNEAERGKYFSWVQEAGKDLSRKAVMNFGDPLFEVSKENEIIRIQIRFKRTVNQVSVRGDDENVQKMEIYDPKSHYALLRKVKISYAIDLNKARKLSERMTDTQGGYNLDDIFSQENFNDMVAVTVKDSLQGPSRIFAPLV